MKKYLPFIYAVVTAIFIGVSIGFLLAKESGHTTIVLARQWGERHRNTETILPETAGLININTANAEDLCDIPGIGQITAKKIISYREQNGAFIVLEDLLNVDGIGNGKLSKIRDYITVGSGE